MPRNLHKEIPDSQKHTPAGFDAAVNSTVLTNPKKYFVLS